MSTIKLEKIGPGSYEIRSYTIDRRSNGWHVYRGGGGIWGIFPTLAAAKTSIVEAITQLIEEAAQ